MRLRRNLLGLAALLSLAAGILAIFARPIAISLYGSSHGLTIKYASLSGNAVITFKGLSVSSSRYGLGMTSEKATLRSDWLKSLFAPAGVDFYLQGVRFNKGEREASGAYNDLADLAAAPFEARWVYTTIRGRYTPLQEGFRLEGLEAVSDDIRLTVDRMTLSGSTIDADLVIHFSGALAERMPQELVKTLLKEEAAGWRSLEVRLSGDYAAPSIQVSGSLFRLNIRSISDGG